MTIVAVAVAVRRTGSESTWSLAAPNRHTNLVRGLIEAGYYDVLDERRWVRGFLTDQGAFLTRLEALAHVLEVGQPLLSSPNPNLGLFSEDLW